MDKINGPRSYGAKSVSSTTKNYFMLVVGKKYFFLTLRNY